MAPSLFLQAEEGVAEEAVLSEGGHTHHLSCHSEYNCSHTHTRARAHICTGTALTSRTDGTDQRQSIMPCGGALGSLSLEAGRSRIDINGLSWQPRSRPLFQPLSLAPLHLCDSSP